MNPGRTEQWKINFQLIKAKELLRVESEETQLNKSFRTPSIGMKINSNYVNVNYSWVGNNAGISFVQNLVICEEVNKSVITSHQCWFVAS